MRDLNHSSVMRNRKKRNTQEILDVRSESSSAYGQIILERVDEDFK